MNRIPAPHVPEPEQSLYAFGCFVALLGAAAVSAVGVLVWLVSRGRP